MREGARPWVGGLCIHLPSCSAFVPKQSKMIKCLGHVSTPVAGSGPMKGSVPTTDKARAFAALHRLLTKNRDGVLEALSVEDEATAAHVSGVLEKLER